MCSAVQCSARQQAWDNPLGVRFPLHGKLAPAPALALKLADVVVEGASSLPVPSLGRSQVRMWPAKIILISLSFSMGRVHLERLQAAVPGVKASPPG